MQDWDKQSISSSNMLGGGRPMSGSKPPGFDAYMARGTSKMRSEDFEMSNMDHQGVADVTPLLPPHQGFAGQQHDPSLRAAYSEEDLVAPSMLRQYTDSSSMHSGYTHSPEVQPVDLYNQQYNRPPPGNAQYPPSREPSHQDGQYRQQQYGSSRQSRGW